MNIPRFEAKAPTGGEACEHDSQNELYARFVRLLDAAQTYEHAAALGINKIIAPFAAARPTKEEFFTLPNAMSLLGFLTVVDGARDITTTKGVLKIAAGRGLDAVDGVIARKLGQTSDFGALTDMTLDKLGMTVIFAEAWKQRTLPRGLLLSIIGNQTASAAIAYASEYQHIDTSRRASHLGKYTMAAELSSLIPLLWEGASQREQGVQNPDLRHTLAYKVALGAEAARWFTVATYAWHEIPESFKSKLPGHRAR